jgi:hypothetical protein
MSEVLTNGFPASIHRFKMNNTAEDENKLIDNLIFILNKKMALFAYLQAD